jgi:protein-S-isoprenylcysteine O-methyltransferase Ste14
VNAIALGLFVVWFVVVFVLRSVVQKHTTGDSGIRPGAFDDGASRTERAAYLLLVLAFVGAIAAPVAAMSGLAPLIDNRLVQVVGLVIAAAGIALTYAAQVGMGSEWRIGIDRDEATDLVTSGMFSLVRNPIFTAMLITAAGFLAIVPNIIALSALICMVAAIELQVRFVEEPHLLRLHGPTYRDYATHVGRFVPLLGTMPAQPQP